MEAYAGLGIDQVWVMPPADDPVGHVDRLCERGAPAACGEPGLTPAVPSLVAMTDRLTPTCCDRARDWAAEDPDPVTKAELEALIEAGDTDDLADRFDGTLEFGTAGLRGALGRRPQPDEPRRGAARGGRPGGVPPRARAPARTTPW